MRAVNNNKAASCYFISEVLRKIVPLTIPKITRAFKSIDRHFIHENKL